MLVAADVVGFVDVAAVVTAVTGIPCMTGARITCSSDSFDCHMCRW